VFFCLLYFPELVYMEIITIAKRIDLEKTIHQNLEEVHCLPLITFTDTLIIQRLLKAGSH